MGVPLHTLQEEDIPESVKGREPESTGQRAQSTGLLSPEGQEVGYFCGELEIPWWVNCLIIKISS
jgi:hypothetical protein